MAVIFLCSLTQTSPHQRSAFLNGKWNSMEWNGIRWSGSQWNWQKSQNFPMEAFHTLNPYIPFQTLISTDSDMPNSENRKLMMGFLYRIMCNFEANPNKNPTALGLFARFPCTGLKSLECLFFSIINILGPNKKNKEMKIFKIHFRFSLALHKIWH